MPDSARILSLAAKSLHKVDVTTAVVPKTCERRGLQLPLLRSLETYVEYPCQQGQKPLVHCLHGGRQEGSWWAGAGGQERGQQKSVPVMILCCAGGERMLQGACKKRSGMSSHLIEVRYCSHSYFNKPIWALPLMFKGDGIVCR
jgi:hypothetical protein